MSGAFLSPNPAFSAFQEGKRRAADLLNAGEPETAVAMLRDLLRQQPRDADLLRMLAVALQGHEDLAVKSREPEPLRLIRFAAQLAPHDPEVLVEHVNVCRSLGMTREAYRLIDQALKAHPTHARAVVVKARMLQGSNRVDEAVGLLQGARAANPDPLLAIAYADLCLHRRQAAEGIDAARPIFDDVTAPVARRIEAAFLLGHLHDALGEYDTAFGYFRTGNTMQGPSQAMDFTAHIQTWTRDFVASIPEADEPAGQAVMVVGMPRSGTTLTEMILAAHPKVSGVGESTTFGRLVHRNPADRLRDRALINAYRDEYVGMLRRCAPDPGADRIVDKMPENYIFLGLAVRMLPGLRVVHCRRDARDTCLSIYFQQFSPGIKYARDLVAIARQYRAYDRLMRHWSDVLDTPIFESVYEDLTADPEPRVRALLDHLGVPFHPACLEHHKSRKDVQTASVAQVRRPIYKTSRQRWKNYERHLGPMLELLEGF